MNSNWRYSLESVKFGAKLAIFVPCDLKIWQMNMKNNKTPLLCYFNLCVSFCSHLWIHTGVTVPKHQFRLKIGDCFGLFSPWELEIWQMTRKMPNSAKNRRFFVPRYLEIWQMILKNNTTPSLCYFKLCATFRNHRWILTRVRVRKRRIWLKIGDFFCPVRPSNLTDDLKKKWAPLWSHFKLCA